MTPEKQEVLWEKLVELKETPGKDGEAPEKRGEPHLLCTEREYLPIYTGRKMAEADLFLYQVYNGLPAPVVSLSEYSWFPTCYVYAPEGESMWKKLISRRFCEKIMPLFGVLTIEELKERISKCTLDRNYRYSSGFAYPAPAILSYVRLEDVAMYP